MRHLALLLLLLLSACVTPTPVPATAQPVATPTAQPATTTILPPAATGTPEPVATSIPEPTATATRALSAEAEALRARLSAEAEALRGLSHLADVPMQFLDRAQLRARLEAEVADEGNAEELAAAGQMLGLLGLLPDQSDVQELMLDLQQSQVTGFYDDEDGVFYLVAEDGEEAFSFEDQITFVHEYIHALQDQHFDLGRFTDDDSGYNEDQRGAVQALIEGEATLAMTLWMLDNFEPDDVLALQESAAAESASLEGTPPYLVQSLAFPYEAGLGFVYDAFDRAEWAGVDALWRDPPTSTEQILHPERYGVDEPTAVALPADLAERLGPGWMEELRDVWGEIDLRLWLDGAGSTVARRAADGWDGSQYLFLADEAGQRLFLIEVVWDSPAEAEEGADAFGVLFAAQGYQANGEGRFRGAERSALLRQAGDRLLVAVADEDGALAAAAEALGWN